MNFRDIVISVLSAGIFILSAVAFTEKIYGKNSPQGADSSMKSLTEAKSTTIVAVGADYISARDYLIKSPDYHLPADNNAISWQERWIADIVEFYRKEPGTKEKIYNLLKGNLGYRCTNAMGKFTIQERAKAVIHGIGPKSLPILVELVWKLWELPSENSEIETAFCTLDFFNDKNTIPMVRDLARPGTNYKYRLEAICCLGKLNDTASSALFATILKNPSEPEEIRIATLGVYAKMDFKDAYETTAAILVNKNESVELRSRAARILTYRKDPNTTMLFHQIIKEQDVTEVLTSVADGIREHYNNQSIKLLQELGKRNSDDVLQTIIEEAIESIQRKSNTMEMK
jgi:hypothetical protein